MAKDVRAGVWQNLWRLALGEGWGFPDQPSLRGEILRVEKAGQQLLIFHAQQPAALLKKAAAAVAKKDGHGFKTLCLLVTEDEYELEHWRHPDQAGQWPRGFLISLPELCCRAEQQAPADYKKLGLPQEYSRSGQRGKGLIRNFTAEVTANLPVGGKKADHYKLRFQAPELRHVRPGQFFMLDTRPRPAAGRPEENKLKILSPDRLSPAARAELGAAPLAYLKRPFGIHRAYYRHFPPHYLQTLSLPPALAASLHTVYPHEFEVLYKVLEHGTGTRALKTVRPGAGLRVTGPLGRPIDLEALRASGAEEIHVVGGGVGMAPLVFLVQALRYQNFPVKAFLGIERLSLLAHADELAESYVEDPRQVYLYYHDLVSAGLQPEDIFVSVEEEAPAALPLKPSQYFYGFVSGQYQAFLKKSGGRKKSAAFACGPADMLHAIHKITQKNQVPLQVLLERRMACGIGVCLSCVCRTEHGKSGYSRVCVEGPVFDAEEIVWD